MGWRPARSRTSAPGPCLAHWYFLYIEADIEIRGDIEVVDIRHAIVVDWGIVRSGVAPVLAF
jgi:hypothetical protein